MKGIKLGLAVALFSLAATIGTNAFAQAANTGFDVIGNIEVPMMYISTSAAGASFNSDLYVGVNAGLGLGYRWTYVGAYLYQDVGGVWLTSDNAPDSGWFLGGTYLGARGILPINDSLQVDLGYAVGMMYTSGTSASDMKEDSGENPPLICNTNGKGVPCFAMKVSLSATYYVTDMIGIGLAVDYNVGIHSVGSMDFTYHNVNVGLHSRFRF